MQIRSEAKLDASSISTDTKRDASSSGGGGGIVVEKKPHRKVVNKLTGAASTVHPQSHASIDQSLGLINVNRSLSSAFFQSLHKEDGVDKVISNI